MCFTATEFSVKADLMLAMRAIPFRNKGSSICFSQCSGRSRVKVPGGGVFRIPPPHSPLCVSNYLTDATIHATAGERITIQRKLSMGLTVSHKTVNISAVRRKN